MSIDVILSLIVFLLVLSILVIVHELGHLLTALFFKTKVEEFGLGYPPKAKTLFRYKGIDFTLNWIPFGGFVRLAGEERRLDGSEEKTNEKQQMFYAKKWWQKIIVILAGAAVNFVVGILAFSFVYTIKGIPELEKLDHGLIVTEVTKDSPAEKVGLKPDDLILAIRNTNGVETKINETQAFIDEIGKVRGQEEELLMERDGQQNWVKVYVRKPEEIAKGDGSVGVAISTDKVIVKHYPVWQMPFRGVWTGLGVAWTFGKMVVTALGQMASQLITKGVLPKDVSGPFGIVHEASKQGLVREGFMAIINFAGVLSINLAVVNVLPIPALDGGRAVFILLEKLMGKRFKPKYEHYANLVGFGALLTLIVLVSIRDVIRILQDSGWLRGLGK
jgi:regulator of sigma E protease